QRRTESPGKGECAIGRRIGRLRKINRAQDLVQSTVRHTSLPRQSPRLLRLTPERHGYMKDSSPMRSSSTSAGVELYIANVKPSMTAEPTNRAAMASASFGLASSPQVSRRSIHLLIQVRHRSSPFQPNEIG